uniref:Uncharacterized protein n=1 Tax=Palpitomonas bilix TaxID=652834 RepID=A0A7S3GLE3_9EUKA|mmetsp:Transcript_8153/g.21605  ORF Transcript_8153/g.21605 Transcript_8153/m.21605 type:complete len:468 (+) Transcript_8153:215-1618(+)
MSSFPPESRPQERQPKPNQEKRASKRGREESSEESDHSERVQRARVESSLVVVAGLKDPVDLSPTSFPQTRDEALRRLYTEVVHGLETVPEWKDFLQEQPLLTDLESTFMKEVFPPASAPSRDRGKRKDRRIERRDLSREEETTWKDIVLSEGAFDLQSVSTDAPVRAHHLLLFLVCKMTVDVVAENAAHAGVALLWKEGQYAFSLCKQWQPSSSDDLHFRSFPFVQVVTGVVSSCLSAEGMMNPLVPNLPCVRTDGQLGVYSIWKELFRTLCSCQIPSQRYRALASLVRGHRTRLGSGLLGLLATAYFAQVGKEEGAWISAQAMLKHGNKIPSQRVCVQTVGPATTQHWGQDWKNVRSPYVLPWFEDLRRFREKKISSSLEERLPLLSLTSDEATHMFAECLQVSRLLGALQILIPLDLLFTFVPEAFGHLDHLKLYKRGPFRPSHSADQTLRGVAGLLTLYLKTH